jgi:hypothetical protein
VPLRQRCRQMSQCLPRRVRSAEQEVALQRYTANIGLLNELFPVFHTAQPQTELAADATSGSPPHPTSAGHAPATPAPGDGTEKVADGTN